MTGCSGTGSHLSGETASALTSVPLPTPLLEAWVSLDPKICAELMSEIVRKIMEHCLLYIFKGSF